MLSQQRATESIRGIVERVTFHNENNGWSVLRVQCFNSFEPTTVIVHQTRVFAGATMKFFGNWSNHPKFGRQFVASRADEEKPASAAALEKYLGSGLIKGIGPKTARKIVSHFGERTLTVFEQSIEDLLQVPGIARKKLISIQEAWEEHRAVSDVMLFLQGHGISTLFAVRIFKKYGQDAIAIVSENPYRLAIDFYGIGFHSADRVALSLGIKEDAPVRIFAAIRHILAASREQGHCYLTFEQIEAALKELLHLDLTDHLHHYLQEMEGEKYLKKRLVAAADQSMLDCYYAKSLYYDEKNSGEKIHSLCRHLEVDRQRFRKWLVNYGKKQDITLSHEQESAVLGIASCGCSILTGGPGCGKTTAIRTLVQLFLATRKKVLLAAPTGRAAQRMQEVIGLEAKTIHRLLEYKNTSFTRNGENQLDVDVLIVDECSMLDISLLAALLAATPGTAQLVLVGDADQLPSVGAGNVLGDLMESGRVPLFRLKSVFRQARESRIISHAHEINDGRIPRIGSPFKTPGLWRERCDCLFIDSNEATVEQLRVIARAKDYLKLEAREEIFGEQQLFDEGDNKEAKRDLPDYNIKGKYDHVDFSLLQTAESGADELRAVLRKVHPWSSLYYGLTAVQVLLRLYSDWIPKYFGSSCEIQLLSPMTRGSLGTVRLNQALQESVNPAASEKGQLSLGERVFRVGDRVIHRKNNYDLGVYNGDIGRICAINSLDMGCTVEFFTDGRKVDYQKDQVGELDLAYAITIHKAQGSEFDCVVIPLVTQHFKMLYRNLVYTGLTRGKKLAVFVGTRQALGMAVRNRDTARRQTTLPILLRELEQHNCERN